MHRHATVIRRRLVVFVAAVLAISACSREKIARSDASGVIQSSASYKQAKVLYVPRVVSIPAEEIGGSVSAREGEALTIIEIASVDPVVALLRARDQVSIEDFVSPVASSIVHPPNPDSVRADSIKKDSIAKADSAKADTIRRPKDDSAKGNVGTPVSSTPPKPPLNSSQTSPPPQPPLAKKWVHTIRVTPNRRPEMADLAVDDGTDFEDSPRPDYSGRPIGRVPGWTLSVASREFIRVLNVADRGAAPAGAPPGEIVVDFLWRWRPTRSGALFDVDGAEFQSLPAEVQQAVQGGSLTLDASTPLWSRATLARDTKGWRVTFIDWSYGLGKPHDPW